MIENTKMLGIEINEFTDIEYDLYLKSKKLNT